MSESYSGYIEPGDRQTVTKDDHPFIHVPDEVVRHNYQEVLMLMRANKIKIGPYTVPLSMVQGSQGGYFEGTYNPFLAVRVAYRHGTAFFEVQDGHNRLMRAHELRYKLIPVYVDVIFPR